MAADANHSACGGIDLPPDIAAFAVRAFPVGTHLVVSAMVSSRTKTRQRQAEAHRHRAPRREYHSAGQTSRRAATISLDRLKSSLRRASISASSFSRNLPIALVSCTEYAVSLNVPLTAYRLAESAMLSLFTRACSRSIAASCEWISTSPLSPPGQHACNSRSADCASLRSRAIASSRIDGSKMAAACSSSALVNFASALAIAACSLACSRSRSAILSICARSAARRW